MESPRNPERRTFLQRLGTVAGGSVLAAELPALLATMDLACTAQEQGAPFRKLTGGLAEFVEAYAARIIPSDDRPGAREAGVVHFIDMVIDTMPPFAGAEDILRETMEAFAVHSGQPFHALSEVDQDALLHEDEPSTTFGILQFLTLAGFLSHPSRGGNRGKVGWGLIGFDDRHAWQPPFGYYDQEANAGGIT